MRHNDLIELDEKAVIWLFTWSAQWSELFSDQTQWTESENQEKRPVPWNNKIKEEKKTNNCSIKI